MIYTHIQDLNKKEKMKMRAFIIGKSCHLHIIAITTFSLAIMETKGKDKKTKSLHSKQPTTSHKLHLRVSTVLQNDHIKTGNASQQCGFKKDKPGSCSQRHPTNDSLYFFKDCWLLMEFLDDCTDFLLPDFCLKIGERRNCRSVNLSPRRSFLLR